MMTAKTCQPPFARWLTWQFAFQCSSQGENVHTRAKRSRYLFLASAVVAVLGSSGCSVNVDRQSNSEAGGPPRAIAPEHAQRATVSALTYGDNDLPVREYACYGDGSQVLAGLGFKVLGDGRYTDLDEAESGSYSVDGDTVTFTGGNLDGMVGRNFDRTHGSFVIGQMAECEPW
jgi:hypothetical protein